MTWLALPAIVAILLLPGLAGAQNPLRAPDPRAEAFTAPPYPSKFVEVDGVLMHYVESGIGDPVLFLHGNPTSSYLWRNVMPHVEPLGRMIALDLPGFGQSGPSPTGYTLQDQQRYVDDFIAALRLENLTLVMHDWGSVLGLDYAMRNERNVKAVVFMESILPPRFPLASYDDMGPAGDLFRRFRDPVEGRKLLITDNMFIEGLLANGAITRELTEAEIEAYRQPFIDPADREPIFVWPSELPIAGKPARNVEVVTRIGEWLKTSDTPKLLLYASPGALVPPWAAEWMADNYRNIEVIFVGYGSHYIQEDDPETIGRNIVNWHQRHFH
jgi:haloalkane dehalogenase